MAVSLTRKPCPQPTKINIALLHVYVPPSVALRLGVCPSSNLSDRPTRPTTPTGTAEPTPRVSD